MRSHDLTPSTPHVRPEDHPQSQYNPVTVGRGSTNAMLYLPAERTTDSAEAASPDIHVRLQGGLAGPRSSAAGRLSRPRTWLAALGVQPLEAALVEGDEDLEVVGESHRQDNLWRMAGGHYRPEVRVRMPVYSMLLAEDGNPYDGNAVSVLGRWVDGRLPAAR